MNKKEVFRIYNFSDATLVMKGRTIVAFIKRDLPKFAQFAVTPASVEELSVRVDAFSDIIPDVMKLGDQKIATEEKDAKAEEVRVIIRDIMTHVAMKYPEGSARYKQFGTASLSQLSDDSLVSLSKTVVATANLMLAELATTGLTVTKLKNLTETALELSELIVAQRLSIGQRDIEQEDRVEAGNALYKELIRLCDIGRNIWETNDVAKTNDYIIYNTKSGENEENPGDFDPI